MRAISVLLLLPFGLGVNASAQAPPACTGLSCQQVSCPGGGTTSITGIVYAPNGLDPLPDVTVYIPNATVAPFTPGVSCPLIGAPPSGSPLLGTFSGVDGSFTLDNVPVGAHIPIVIQSGRWRRQITIPNVVACANTVADISMPQDQSQGDIPKIAVATGSADQVECVLRKIGISDSEFTNPGGTGRVNFYSGTGSPGARIDTATPNADALMGNTATLNSYDVLMLPCEGDAYVNKKTPTDLANLVEFANAGGRVYSSHFSYAWMNYSSSPFNGVVNWDTQQSEPTPDPGTATVVTDFSQGQTLSQWLELVGASTTTGTGIPAQISIQTLRHDFNGVNAPTQSWLTLNNTTYGNPVMQFVFDTPIGQTVNQCGRVLFNEYHVENPVGNSSSQNATFPAECGPLTPMTPQEKLLEFSLFDLTGNGNSATLTPLTQDFGTQALNFASAAQTFIWTNNSFFPTGVTYLNASGDFSVTGSNCATVAAGASCQISVVFTPTALGARTGTLTVGSASTNLTSALTGTGIPDLTVSTTAMAFGSLDVGNTTSQTLTLTNIASGSVPGPSIVMTGDYSETTNCGSVVPANSNCLVTVTFKPSAVGPRAGTLVVNPNPTPTTLTGNGIDFSLSLSSGSGSVVAGYNTSVNLTATPIDGFSAPISLTCTTTAAASTCTPSLTSFTPSSPMTTAVSITTTSKYTVVGYSSIGGSSFLLLLAIGSGCLLWTRRKKSNIMARAGLFVLFLTAVGASLTGCGDHVPAEHASYTAPGNYTYTLTATDGFLTRSATYDLTVTVK